MIGGSASMASRFMTSHMIAARAMKRGAGGIHARPTAASVAATTPIARVTRSAARQVRPLARRTTGVTATEAANALARSETYGGRPTSGSATLSAAKIDTARRMYPSHGRGCTIARYHGSKVARSAITTSNTRKNAFSDVSVALA